MGYGAGGGFFSGMAQGIQSGLKIGAYADQARKTEQELQDKQDAKDAYGVVSYNYGDTDNPDAQAQKADALGSFRNQKALNEAVQGTAQTQAAQASAQQAQSTADEYDANAPVRESERQLKLVKGKIDNFKNNWTDQGAYAPIIDMYNHLPDGYTIDKDSVRPDATTGTFSFDLYQEGKDEQGNPTRTFAGTQTKKARDILDSLDTHVTDWKADIDRQKEQAGLDKEKAGAKEAGVKADWAQANQEANYGYKQALTDNLESDDSEDGTGGGLGALVGKDAQGNTYKKVGARLFRFNADGSPPVDVTTSASKGFSHIKNPDGSISSFDKGEGTVKPTVDPTLNSIRSQVRAGKMTEDQAREAMLDNGYAPDQAEKYFPKPNPFNPFNWFGSKPSSSAPAAAPVSSSPAAPSAPAQSAKPQASAPVAKAPQAQAGGSPFKQYPDAKQAPDGHWYVQRNGAWNRVDK